VGRRARVRGDRHQVTLPPEVREALQVRSGDEIEFAVDEHGTVTVRGYTSFPTDQAWFFTPAWQVGEREADEQIASGRHRRYAAEITRVLSDLAETVAAVRPLRSLCRRSRRGRGGLARRMPAGAHDRDTT
jgi:antitoxin PrlF